MANFKVLGSLVALTVALGFLSAGTPQDELVPYPEGFRLWTHVSSGVIGPASPAYAHFGGLHHIYANALAMRGYADGRFPNGSVVVFDVFEVSITNDVTTQTRRRLVDVMHKDSARFAATGGWGFGEFAGDTRDRNAIVGAQCAKCHSARGADLVISKYVP